VEDNPRDPRNRRISIILIQPKARTAEGPAADPQPGPGPP